MGYHSDVALMAVLPTAEIADEVMAVYAMHPPVQVHGCLEDWKRAQIDDYTILYFSATSVKWYESYEDVMAYEHLHTILQQFHDNRGVHFAYGKARIGEDVGDIVYGVHSTNDPMNEVIYAHLQINRELVLDLKG